MCKIYLATWLLEQQQSAVLTKAKGNNRLLSFYHSKETPDKKIKRYAITGLISNQLKEKTC